MYDIETAKGLNDAIADAARFADDFVELKEWAEDMGMSVDAWQKPRKVPAVVFNDWYLEKVNAKKQASQALIKVTKEVRGRAWFSDLLAVGNDLIEIRKNRAGGGLVDADGDYTARTNYSGGISDLTPEQLAILLNAVKETEQRFAPAKKLTEK